MKIFKNLFVYCTFILISGSLFIGCYDIEDTGSIYQPREVNSVQITDVIPQVAGSTSEITIVGSGFAENIEDNWVYFNYIPATIKSMTSSEIVVYRPKIASDSIVIRVASSGVTGQGIYANNYPMESIIDTFGVYLQPLDKITNFCVDKDDNIYILFYKTSEIRKFNESGKEDSVFTPVTGDDVLYALDIKEGPDEYIYFLRKKGPRTYIYRFSEISGGMPEEYYNTRAALASFDYDENGNIYIGGRGSGFLQGALRVLKPDLTEVEYNMYDGYNIKSLRVYNDELYVLAEYIGTDTLNTHISGIFKNQIMSDGQLDTSKTLLLDWSLSGDYQSFFYNSFSIAEDGEIYVGTDFIDPVLSLSTSGEVSKLYYGLLNPEANRMMWGGGTYLYLLLNIQGNYQEGNLIQRIDMGKSGAPLYGRDL